MNKLNDFILNFIMVLMLMCTFNSCNDEIRQQDPSTNTAGAVANNAPAPDKTKSPLEQKLEILQKQLDDLNKKTEKAESDGNKIEKLTSEKDALDTKRQIAEVYVQQWKDNATAYSSQEKEKEKELATAKVDAWKVKLWWMAGICGLLGIFAFAITLAYPLLAPFASKAWKIFGIAAAVMLVVAESLSTVAWLIGFVPYIIGLAAAIGVIYGIAALRHWWLDHHTSNQLIESFEKIKAKIPNFADHMDATLDTAVIKHIEKKRIGLNLKKKPIISTTTDISGNK